LEGLSLSLGEAVEIYEIMLKIDTILNGITLKMDAAETKAKATGISVMRLEMAFMRLGWAISRVSGDPNLDKTISKVMEVIRVTRYAQMAIVSLNALMAMTPGANLIYGTQLLYTGTMAVATYLSAGDFNQMG
jgi:hypothetical protein